MKQDKDKIWIKYMNKKIRVKRGQVKKLGDFPRIVLTSYCLKKTVFLMFLQFPGSVILCLAAYFNNSGIIIT